MTKKNTNEKREQNEYPLCMGESPEMQSMLDMREHLPEAGDRQNRVPVAQAYRDGKRRRLHRMQDVYPRMPLRRI
jgi:hypothetical protein